MKNLSTRSHWQRAEFSPRKNKKTIDKANKEDWDKMCEYFANLPKFSYGGRLIGKPADSKPVTLSSNLSPRAIPSRVTPGGSTAEKEHHIYTGSKMIGIAQMHKSNMVPVFAKEEVEEIGHMRR